MLWSEMVSSQPLTYDPGIYWAHPIWHVEHRIARSVLRDARFDPREYARRYIADTVEQEAKQQNWGRYTWRDEERPADYGDVILRRDIYAQPGFRTMERWRAPSSINTIKLLRRTIPRQANEAIEPEEIELQRLWYHGERVRGCLIDDVLYVVFS